MEPVQFFKCLSDDTRLRCVLLIFNEDELCVCELTTALQVLQPKISRHLAQLKQFGILTDRRQGQWIYYQINNNLASWAKDIIKATAVNNSDLIKLNLTSLNEMGERPERVRSFC